MKGAAFVAGSDESISKRESDGRRILMITTQDDTLDEFEANEKQQKEIRRSSMRCKACWFFNPIGNSQQFRINSQWTCVVDLFGIGVQYPFESKLMVGNCLH